MSFSIVLRLITSRSAGAIASLALLIFMPSTGFAAGTEAQREACAPDAFRLCTMAMPDEKRVENCLRAAGPRLSRACYDVFYPPEAHAPDQVTRGQAPVRDRMQPQYPPVQQMPPESGEDEQ